MQKLALILPALVASVQAFVQPTTFTTTHHSQLNLFSPDHYHDAILSASSSIILSDDAEAVASAEAALQGVRTFFTVILAIVFGFAGLTYVTAAFIVPQAAAQLETDTKRLRPGLWEEYEAKLEEGETLATRPDLLQELGNIMQPIIIEDFEKSANAKDAPPTSNSNIDDQWKD